MPVSIELLLLARHGESTWNAERRWQGQGDPPLSKRGRLQAAGLADALAGQGVEALVSSDLARAAETAAIVARRLGLAPPRLEPRLRERSLGEWTGRTEAEIAAGWPSDLARLRTGDPELRPGGGESGRELAQRVHEALRELAAAPPGGRVALVTHLGVIRALVPGFRPANAEWCRLELAG
jgi:probable phosphoglycerate mutase